MYKAVNIQLGEEIVILDPRWRKRLPELRQMDRQDQLVCQGCLQPVRVRAGQFKRPHFAHKHLKNCPYQNESPALLSCRALLYEWLVGQFGEASVTLEKKLPDSPLPRPVDAWVSLEGREFAYWIVETRLHPELRQALLQAFDRLPVQVHWVFISQMLNVEAGDPRSIYLTTTEREFMQTTPFDEVQRDMHSFAGKSLHYLDPQERSLATFRELKRVHRPQRFRGRVEFHLLEQVTASAENGEFIHPGELDRLEQVQSDRRRWEEKLKTAEQALQRISAYTPEKPALSTPRSTWFQEPSPEEQAGRDPFSSQEATCMFCGKKTSQWWYLDRKTGLCKCKECLKAGKQ